MLQPGELSNAVQVPTQGYTKSRNRSTVRPICETEIRAVFSQLGNLLLGTLYAQQVGRFGA
jgi:hypothetical protein